MKQPPNISVCPTGCRGLFALGASRSSLLTAVCLLMFCSCATRPHTYTPPDAGKLKASTQRVAKAVEQAHQNARKAQERVNTAAETTKRVQDEIAKLENVPPTVTAGMTQIQEELDNAKQAQASLEKDLVEADAAKAEVEKDKEAYFKAAQSLADSATAERDLRIKAEKALHWYRVRWWGAWIVLGAGVIACGIWTLLKFGIIAGSKL